MIGKVSRGADVGGLLRYLYGPGRFNEHVRPHLVASWAGDDAATLAALEPALGVAPAAEVARHDVSVLAGRLALPLQLQPDVDRPVWHCSMRTAPGDRSLTDAEWAQVARDVLHRTGFAPHGDPHACRWVAVRHADDHIHIAVVLARLDGHPVSVYRDWTKVHAAARAAERTYGLQVIAAPAAARAAVGRTPSRGELGKAARVAGPGASTPRRWLTERVRAAAATSLSREAFASRLEQLGVMVTWRMSTLNEGEVTGYAVGRPGDVDAAGKQIFYAGSTLAPNLSLPQLEARWGSAPGTLSSTLHVCVRGAQPRPTRSHMLRPYLAALESGLTSDAHDAVTVVRHLLSLARTARVLGGRSRPTPQRRH